MPIIPLKNNPPSRFPNRPIISSIGKWWIAKVKPHQEKAFAFELLRQNIEYYLPYYIKVNRRTDGSYRKSLVVLFPSYVAFVTENPYILSSLNRIVKLLPIKCQERFKIELQQIYTANESGIQLYPNQQIASSGQNVKILTGPLKGVVGKILQINGVKSLIIEVDGLGAVSISMASNQIKLEQFN